MKATLRDIAGQVHTDLSFSEWADNEYADCTLIPTRMWNRIQRGELYYSRKHGWRNREDKK